MAAIRFDVSSDERALIQAIAQRALLNAVKAGLPIVAAHLPAHVEIEMDVTAVHRNGCALRLRDLLDADDFNFNHDVYGIRRYLDRDSGQLTCCFTPRFAAPETAVRR
jgi:hypothetical protein